MLTTSVVASASSDWAGVFHAHKWWLARCIVTQAIDVHIRLSSASKDCGVIQTLPVCKRHTTTRLKNASVKSCTTAWSPLWGPWQLSLFQIWNSASTPNLRQSESASSRKSREWEIVDFNNVAMRFQEVFMKHDLPGSLKAPSAFDLCDTIPP